MSSESKRYGKALAVVVRATAAAYGYTLTISASVATLMSTQGTPSAGSLFLFVGGGLAAFAGIDALLVLVSDGEADDPDRFQAELPLAGALNLIAVAAGLGAATGLAHAVAGALAWLVVGSAATAAYLLVLAAQLAVAERVRERRRA